MMDGRAVLGCGLIFPSPKMGVSPKVGQLCKRLASFLFFLDLSSRDFQLWIIVQMNPKLPLAIFEPMTPRERYLEDTPPQSPVSCSMFVSVQIPFIPGNGSHLA